MPALEQRLAQLKAMVTEVLIKQDELAAQLHQQSASIRRQNADVLRHLGQQTEKPSQSDSQLGQLGPRIDKLERVVEQGFIGVNQRLTDLFALLGRKLE